MQPAGSLQGVCKLAQQLHWSTPLYFCSCKAQSMFGLPAARCCAQHALPSVWLMHALAQTLSLLPGPYHLQTVVTLSVPPALPASQQTHRQWQGNLRGAAGSLVGSQTACLGGMAPTVGSQKDALCEVCATAGSWALQEVCWEHWCSLELHTSPA